MAKVRQKLKFRLPEYVSPRNAWRKRICDSAMVAVKNRGVSYPEDAQLAVVVKLYLRGRALEIHDVDNRLKDILDALQGRMGGSKAVRKFVPSSKMIGRFSAWSSPSLFLRNNVSGSRMFRFCGCGERWFA